jgi:hypothetical protein
LLFRRYRPGDPSRKQPEVLMHAFIEIPAHNGAARVNVRVLANTVNVSGGYVNLKAGSLWSSSASATF